MKTHILKIEEQYAKSLMNGSKRYELRRNDRDYQSGDWVGFVINDFCDVRWELPRFKITHVLMDVPQYGLESGFCIISLEKIKVIEGELIENT